MSLHDRPDIETIIFIGGINQNLWCKGGKLVSDCRQYVTITNIFAPTVEQEEKEKRYSVIIIPSFVPTYHPVGGPR